MKAKSPAGLRSLLLSIMAMFMVIISAAQKKLVEVRQSPLTGVSLPSGSKKDGRFLSEIAGKALLEMESKKANTTIGTVEVLYLPAVNASGFNADSLVNQFSSLGWNIIPVENDNKYVWLEKDNRYVIAYFSMNKTSTDLYFGEATTAPAIVVNMNNSQVNQQIDVQQTVQQTDPQQQVQSTSNETTIAVNNTQATNQDINTPASQQGFAFFTTNFDDGWTSVIQNDWVLVSKGDIKVYLWYALPYNASDFSGTGLVERDYYWENYVSKYYTIETRQYKDNGEVLGSQKPSYIEGWATDKQTGERRFIGMRLDIAPNTAYITIGSARDEASLWNQFPKANGGAFSPSDLSNMSRYNKFAISESDVQGTWSKGNSSTAQWYYVTPSGYEGYAGMTIAATSATFTFNNGGSYTSIHNGATGTVGNLSTFQQNYKGNYTVGNWTLTATNRWQGKTDNFEACFVAVKGGRILCLREGGMEYNLVKVK